MQIDLNGETREISPSTDLSDLVDQLSLPSHRIAVELNGIVVRRINWPETQINDGDRLEVVHFVGGG